MPTGREGSVGWSAKATLPVTFGACTMRLKIDSSKPQPIRLSSERSLLTSSSSCCLPAVTRMHCHRRSFSSLACSVYEATFLRFASNHARIRDIDCVMNVTLVFRRWESRCSLWTTCALCVTKGACKCACSMVWSFWSLFSAIVR